MKRAFILFVVCCVNEICILPVYLEDVEYHLPYK